MKSNIYYKYIIVSSLVFSASQAYAIDLDNGDYVTAPQGTQLAMLYLQHANRDSLYSNGKKLQGENELISNIGIARYVYYTKLGNYTIAPQILIPFGQIEANKDISSLGKTSGFGDIILAVPLWAKEDKDKGEYLGFTPYLYFPTGKYSQNSGLNLGENRYKLVLQTGYSNKILNNIQWDIAGDVTFYGDNNDYLNNTKLEQDLGYQIQSSFKYPLKSNLDITAGLSYSNFGETKVNDIKTEAAEQTKIWIGSNFSLTPTTQFLLTMGKDLNVDNTFKEDLRVNFRFLHAF